MDTHANRFTKRPMFLVATIAMLIASICYGLPLLGLGGDSLQTVGAIGWMVAVPFYVLSLIAGEHRRSASR